MLYESLLNKKKYIKNVNLWFHMVDTTSLKIILNFIMGIVNIFP